MSTKKLLHITNNQTKINTLKERGGEGREGGVGEGDEKGQVNIFDTL
jgi:hypothetical protein